MAIPLHLGNEGHQRAPGFGAERAAPAGQITTSPGVGAAIKASQDRATAKAQTEPQKAAAAEPAQPAQETARTLPNRQEQQPQAQQAQDVAAEAGLRQAMHERTSFIAKTGIKPETLGVGLMEFARGDVGTLGSPRFAVAPVPEAAAGFQVG